MPMACVVGKLTYQNAPIGGDVWLVPDVLWFRGVDRRMYATLGGRATLSDGCFHLPATVGVDYTLTCAGGVLHLHIDHPGPVQLKDCVKEWAE